MISSDSDDTSEGNKMREYPAKNEEDINTEELNNRGEKSKRPEKLKRQSSSPCNGWKSDATEESRLEESKLEDAVTGIVEEIYKGAVRE